MSSKQKRYLAQAKAAKDRFLEALRQPKTCQDEMLRETLERHRETSFGQEHGFAEIRDVDDFRRRVPIRDYDGLSPWIERAASGESSVLTAEDPRLFFSSSGSTGTRKKIPVTQGFVEKVYLPFFYAAIGNTVACCPEAVERDDATLNMKWDPMRSADTTTSGAAHLGASQVDFAKRFGDELAAEPGTRAPWAFIPAEVDDELDRMYFRLRLAVESDVRCVVGINPTMVAMLPRQLEQWTERLVAEVHDGTVLGQASRPGNPARAAELEKLSEYFGVLRPHHVWPRLKLIYCWTGGVAKTYLGGLRAAYGPEVEVLPAPIAASEGPIGLPIDRHPTAGPLVLPCVFYEFIDADRAIDADRPTLLFDQLEVGGEYHVIITHLGGLYRYALGDVARVVDKVMGVPRVEYAGRHVPSSLVGERLRETQVIDALMAALARHGLGVHNFTCRALLGQPAHYAFLLETTTAWKDDEVVALARSLDESLQRVSQRYGQARRDELLDPVEILVAENGAFERHFAARLAAGIRPTQIKDSVFQRDAVIWAALTEGSTSSAALDTADDRLAATA